MKKLDVRFEELTSKIISEMSDKHKKTFSKVARDAITIGLGVMTSELEYIDPLKVIDIKNGDNQ